MVDGRHRRERRALRPGRESEARPRRCHRSSSRATPTGATSISMRSRRSGSQLVGRLAGDSRRQGAVLRLVAQSVRARRSQAGPAARTPSTSGRRPTASSDAVDPPHRFEPTRVEASPPLGLDLTRGGIRTIIWATGFRPDYSWLDVPVLDPRATSATTAASSNRRACT